MTTFYEREQAFEAKFAHDQNFRFLVTARRDKLFAKWGAERLRLSGKTEADLTASVLAVPDGAGHDARLLSHMMAVMSEHGDKVEQTELAKGLNTCGEAARQQLLAMPLLDT